MAGLIMALSGWVIYRFRQTRCLTLAEFFERRYGRGFRVFAGLISFLAGLIKKAKGDIEAKPQHEGPYTVSEAARLLGVSTRHVYDLCKEGKIACHRHGRRITITKEQFEAYLVNNGESALVRFGQVLVVC